MFALLTGRSPFEPEPGEPLARVIARIENEPADRLSPDVAPFGLALIIERGLAKRPERRQPSAADFAAQLQKVQVAAGDPVTPVHSVPRGDANPTTSHETLEAPGSTLRVRPRGRPRARRARIDTRWAVAAAIILIIAGLVAVFAPRSSGTKRAPNKAAADSRVVFEDQFDANAAGWSTGLDEDGGGAAFVDGRYRVDVNNPNGSEVSDTNFLGRPVKARFTHLTDDEVSVSGKLLTPAGVYGVVCRHAADGAFYEGVVGTDGVYGLYKGQRDGASPAPLVKGTQSFAAGSWTDIALDCRTVAHGSAVELTLHVADRELTSFTDRRDPIGSGSAGVVVGAQSKSPASALFDHFTIRSIGPKRTRT